MLLTIRSFLEYPNPQKLDSMLKLHKKVTQYSNGVNEILSIIEDIYREFDTYPSLTALGQEVSLVNSQEATQVYMQIASLQPLPEGEFFTHIRMVEKLTYEQKLTQELLASQDALAQMQNKSVDSISKYIEDTITKVSQIKSVFSDNESTISSISYGKDAVNQFKQDYQDICTKKDSDEALYLSLGLGGAFKDLQLKKSDLFVVAGFTSHGKSIFLKWFVYRLLTVYHYNCYYLSLEMSHRVIRNQFFILHANNKDIFPGTPFISYDAYKNGALTDEENDFLFNVAAPDFTQNENYGTLYLEQPESTKVRLSDLERYIKKVETEFMPIDCVAVDYLSLMYPLESNRGRPEVDDYNLLVKSFKNMANTHTDPQGREAPFLAVTPAQISRNGYEQCLKTEKKVYESSAIWKYTEFERSSDALMTVFLTEEERNANKIKIQLLKNRDGKLDVEPVDVYCDLDKSCHLSDISKRTETQTIEALRSLDI